MQPTTRWTPSLARLTGRMLAAWLLSTLDPVALAAGADTIARPAIAREVARRNAEQPAHAFKADGDASACHAPTFEMEPLRDLLDKYAPSAVEWSLLPHIADSFSAYSSRRRATPNAG